MSVRRACRSGSFYPASGPSCRTLLSRCLESAPPPPSPSGRVVGGLVPHAGLVYSGTTAAATFRAIGEPAPCAFVIFGAVHVAGVQRPTVAPETAWGTPLGDVPVDREIVALLREECGDALDEGAAAHRSEHSIEVQVPFIAHLFPGAAIVPIAAPPSSETVAVGEAVGAVVARLPGRVVVLGSTDLTHYGRAHFGFAPRGSGPEAHRWAKEENDRSFLERAVAMDALGALHDSRAKRNACGAGAAAAAIAASMEMGAAEGRLLDHTTSFEVRGAGTDPTDFVGYASVIFSAPNPLP